ncbi:SCP-2 sterol transfer family protein [Janthinobacterium sp. HH103]|nr:SCP-2 sterol transfer family protein [Janthinobacterium sp. HH100]OEZ87144.1 SCP-2 sterol transfer family protein [Janthinobacterium sp. HH103]OEZ89544.1 SCP-2 sterol transfer family protein [Janthinobacterium sp. HH106]OEZ97306.1 SCP-2 sterol transfer family protein [Janthinobacterium sp. HH107]QOU72974.1 SCP-2 sterol transfer family protein [Janthinobacterium sp. HH102]
MQDQLERLPVPVPVPAKPAMSKPAVSYRLPEPLAELLSKLPPYPASWLFVQGLNRLLAPQLPDDVRCSLEGRSLRLRLLDAGIAFDFEWQGTVFVAERYVDVPDLCIAASVHDLMLLARRQEDPDTLFFSRRLSLEGDTELGLLFKNTLDAIELPPFDLQSLGPRRVLAHLRDRGARGG